LNYDLEAAERVRHVLSSRDGVVEKRMVGGLSFLVNGNMCCGITDRALMVRVGAKAGSRHCGSRACADAARRPDPVRFRLCLPCRFRC
jgi:TfoX/Sxy family transcriptional regulator of competence genes